MARKKNSRLRLRLIGVALLVLLAGSGWAWWHLSGWTPERAEFPVQGVEVGGEDGQHEGGGQQSKGVHCGLRARKWGGHHRDSMRLP